MRFTIPAALAATLVLASPALAQNMSTGNASTPGASVSKDDQTYKPMRSKKHVAKHTRRHTKPMSSQTTGSGSSSAPGASVNKDDTKQKTK